MVERVCCTSDALLIDFIEILEVFEGVVEGVILLFLVIFFNNNFHFLMLPALAAATPTPLPLLG